MNKRARRKKQIARRVTAILLSLAMVFSVIYLNDRNTVSEADELALNLTGEFLDDSYLKNQNVSEEKEITVTVPSGLISFSLPDKPAAADGYVYYWCAAESDLSTNADKLVSATEITPFVLSKDNISVTLYKCKDGDTTAGSEREAEIIPLITFKYVVAKPEGLGQSVVQDSDSKWIVSVSGSDAYSTSDTDTTLYYAEAKYACEEYLTQVRNNASEVDASKWSDFDSLKGSLNSSDNSKDIKYVVSKKITLKDSASTVVAFDSILVSRDTYMNLSASIRDEQGSVGTVDGHNLSIVNVAPGHDVTVSFSKDDKDDITEIKAQNKEVSTDVITETSGTSIVFPKDTTIGSGNTNSGKTKEYVVTVKGTNKNTETFNVTISYVSPDPEVKFKSVMYNGSNLNPLEGKYYVKGQVQVIVEASAPDENVNLHNVKLIDASDNSEVVSKTTGGNKQDVWLELTPSVAGEKTYKAWADTDKTGQAFSDDTITIFYDTAIPEISEIKVSQSINDKKRSQTVSGGTVGEKLTTTKPFTFEISAKDGEDESGVAKVTVIKSGDTNIYECTQSGDVFELTFTPEEGDKGQTINYQIIAEDRAGNKTDYKSVNLTFAKDEIKITSEYKDAEDTTIESPTSVGKFNIVYSFESDVKLDTAELKLSKVVNGVSTDETKPVTFDQTIAPESDEKYRYTYIYPVDTKQSEELRDIEITATNVNGVVSDKYTISLITIDLAGPDATYTLDPDDQARIDNKEWFRNLAIIVNFEDKSPSGGMDDQTKIIPDTDLKGLRIRENSFNFDPKERKGQVIFDVAESADMSGTVIGFKIVDSLGNEYVFPDTTVYVDKHEPDISDVTVSGKLGPGGVYKDNPTISFKVSDNIKLSKVTASISKQGGATVDISSYLNADLSLDPTDVATLLGGNLEDGTYTLTITALDLPIEAQSAPKSVTKVFTIDNTPPTLSAKLESPEIIKNGMYTNEKEVVVLLHVEDPHLDLNKLKVYDNAIEQKVSWKDSAGGVKDARLVVSKETVHKVTLEAADGATNKNIVAAPTFVIDTTNPIINTTLFNDPYYEKSYSYLRKTAEIGVNVQDNNKDVVHGLTITEELMPHDGSKSTTTVRKDQKDGTYKYSSDGDYVITYTAEDLAGNKKTRKIRFTVDKTVPVNNITIRKPENAAKFDKYHTAYENEETGASYTYAQYYNHDVVMDITAEDYNMKKILATDSASDTPILEIDNYDSQESGSYSIPYTASSEGMHTIAVTTWDRSGNVSTVKTVSFVIDKTKPVLNTTLNASSFVSGGETRYLNTNGTVAVTVSDANKDKEDLTRTLKVTPPGGSASTTVSKVNEGSQDFTSEADYDVSFVAVDLAGNESATHETTFRVDKTAPELRISGASDGGASTQAVNIVYNVHEAFYSDMTKAIVRVYRKLDGSGESLIRTVDFKATGQDSSMTENFSEDGEYRFEFEAEDRTGNTANTSYSFMLDATAPTIVLNGVKNYDKTKEDVEVGILVTENFYTTNTLNIDGTRIDIDGKKNAVKVEPFNANRSRELNIVQIFKEDGIYDLNINSKDRAGNEAKQSVHFTIDKTAPEIGDLSKYDGKKLNKFVWDIDEQKLVRDLTVCDVTIYLDGTVYDGMANLTDGSHVLRVTATDELGNSSSKEVTFQLDQIAPNIIVTGIEDKQRIEEPVNISVSLQIDTDILDSVTLNDSPVTLDGNTANFKVDSAGDYKLVVKAHDEAENQAELEWTFTYGSKFNWWWIVAIGGGVLLLLIILLIIRRKSWSKK